jgi:SHS2 domain-containing protein
MDHPFDIALKIRYTDTNMNDHDAGYREIEHTADCELHVWGSDESTLLEQSARGMYDLSQTILASKPRVVREFKIHFLDRESLIVDFLSELLFYGEDEGLGFDTFQIALDRGICTCCVIGAPIANHGKEIKAVTYHGMEVSETAHGLEVRIVFDV